MTTALVLLDSYVVGLWEDLLNRDGLFTGQRGIATDYGNAELGGLQVLWDGSAWRIAPGAVLARHATGALAPITLTGVTTSGKFTLPSSIAIPHDAIPNYSRICVRARVMHTTTSAIADVKAWLGTADSTGDSLLGQVRLRNVTNDVAWLESQAVFNATTNTFFATGKLKLQDSDDDASIGVKNTNVNRGDDMYVSLGVTTSQSSDEFSLIDYLVWCE